MLSQQVLVWLCLTLGGLGGIGLGVSQSNFWLVAGGLTAVSVGTATPFGRIAMRVFWRLYFGVVLLFVGMILIGLLATLLMAFTGSLPH